MSCTGHSQPPRPLLGLSKTRSPPAMTPKGPSPALAGTMGTELGTSRVLHPPRESQVSANKAAKGEDGQSQTTEWEQTLIFFHFFSLFLSK